MSDKSDYELFSEAIMNETLPKKEREIKIACHDYLFTWRDKHGNKLYYANIASTGNTDPEYMRACLQSVAKNGITVEVTVKTPSRFTPR